WVFRRDESPTAGSPRVRPSVVKRELTGISRFFCGRGRHGAVSRARIPDPEVRFSTGKTRTVRARNYALQPAGAGSRRWRSAPIVRTGPSRDGLPLFSLLTG